MRAGRARATQLPLQVLMDDVDQFLGRLDPRVLASGIRVEHVLADVILDHLRDETVERSAARSGLLQHAGAFLVGFDRALDGADLSAQTAQSHKELRFLFGHVTRHRSNSSCIYYRGVYYTRTRGPRNAGRSSPRSPSLARVSASPCRRTFWGATPLRHSRTAVARVSRSSVARCWSRPGRSLGPTPPRRSPRRRSGMPC